MAQYLHKDIKHNITTYLVTTDVKNISRDFTNDCVLTLPDTDSLSSTRPFLFNRTDPLSRNIYDQTIYYQL